MLAWLDVGFKYPVISYIHKTINFNLPIKRGFRTITQKIKLFPKVTESEVPESGRLFLK